MLEALQRADPYRATAQAGSLVSDLVEKVGLGGWWGGEKKGEVKDAVAGHEEYDLLIVGGGATGAGVALDAASRGLKVALVERDDFSSGI
jgi:NADPH-dependent 2,4-dienoyl-CoA reductase/sulfur reductase-like enzyme